MRRTAIGRAAAGAALLATATVGAGCERLRIEEPPPPIPAATQVLVRPASLELRAGEAVQLAAQASTPDRQPIGGAPIEYEAITPGLVHVTSTGLATSLGPAGTAEVVARSGAAAGGTVISVVAADPAAIRPASGANQTGAAGAPLEQPIVAVVTDGFGNPVRGIPVEIFSSSSGGSVAPQRGVTDGDGMVEASWSLGPRAGRQSVSVAVADRRDLVVPFVATATAGPTAGLQPASAPERAVAGAPTPLRVEARDAFGNAAPVANLTWTISSGTIVPGEAPGAATWTPSPAGTATLEASLPGADLVARWSIEVVPGAPANATAVGSPPTPARPGAEVTGLAVRVTDAAGNAIAGRPVNFEIGEGGGTVEPTSATTDGDGRATIGRWTLGPTGAQVVRATVDGLAPVTFSTEIGRARRPRNRQPR